MRVLSTILAMLIACSPAAALSGRQLALAPGAPYFPTPATAPANLNFSVVVPPTRNQDLFSGRFPVDPPNLFQSSTPAADYTEVNLIGSPTYAYSGSGATISGSVTGQGVLKSKVFPLAPYLYSEVVVASAATNADVTVGFSDPTLAQYMLAQYTTGSGVSLGSKINGASSSIGNVAYTPTSYPFTLRLLVEWPDIQLWLTDGNGTRLMMWTTMSTATDLRLNTKWQAQGFSAYFSAQSHTNAPWSATFGSFRSGYTGALGTTNPKPVTYLNGQPFIKNNKAYFFGTCNNGSTFLSGHGGVYSVNLSTFEVKYESLFFFNVSSSAPTSPTGPFDTTTSLSVGQVLWDGSKWVFFLSNWGYHTQLTATGIQIYTASTTVDPTSGNNVIFMNAYQLTMPSSGTASYYDNTQYQDALGTWHVSAAQTSSLSSWASFAPSLFTGPAMSSLSLVNGPSATHGEGPNWVKIAGTNYLAMSGNSGSTSPHWFDAGLNLIGGGIFPGTIDLATYPPAPGTGNFYSHFLIVPIPWGPQGAQTRYALLYMDNSTVTPVLSGALLSAARSTLVVEMTPPIFGNEHF